MRKKILGILVCMLMVGTVFSAVSGNLVVKNDSDSVSDCGVCADEPEWVTQLVDSEGDVGLYSDLIADGINQFISYYDKTNGDLRYAVWDGVSWDIDVVDSEGDVGQHSSLAFSFGNPCISYYDNTNHDLKFAYWTPIDELGNGYWVNETVDSVGNVGWGSSLSFSTGWNGDVYFSIPHISYYDYTNNKLKYAFKSSDDLKWYNFTIDDGGLYNEMVLFDSEGINKGIAYTGANGGLKYCYYYCSPDGGCWWIDTVVDNSGEGWDVSLACDANDHPHISYYKNGKLYYTWRSGASFTTPVVVDNVVYGGWGSSIATYGDEAYVSYYKYDTKDLYYKVMSESSGVPLLTEGDVGQHSSIFVYDGLVHVSCYDNTNDDLVKVFQEKEEEECLLINASFQPVQVVYQDDPLHGNDMTGGPCEWNAGLDMVAGKNTRLFGYPYGARKWINITVCNNLKNNEPIVDFVFTIDPGNKVIYRIKNIKLLKGTHVYSYSFPSGLGEKDFQWDVWSDASKSKNGYINLSLNPDVTKDGTCDICKCSKVSVSVNVNKTHPLTVLFLPFSFTDGPKIPDNFKLEHEPSEFQRWLEESLSPWWSSIYPVKESGLKFLYVFHVISDFVVDGIKVNNDSQLEKLTDAQLNKLYDKIDSKVLGLSWLSGGSSPQYMGERVDRIVTLLNGSVLRDANGLAFLIPISRANTANNKFNVLVNWSVRAQTAPHEVSHTYGLSDCYPDGRPATKKSKTVGYWFDKGNKGDIIDSEDYRDLMYYTWDIWNETKNNKSWIKKPNYKILLHRFTENRDPQVLGIAGFIDKDDNVELLPWYQIENGLVDIEWDLNGDYILKAYNKNHQLIDQTGFYIDFVRSVDPNNGPVEVENVLFAFRVEMKEGISRIDIVKSGSNKILATRTVTQNKPQLKITSPTNGKTLKPEIYEVTWEASDIDGDPITTYLLLSNNSGLNWYPVSIAMTDLSRNVDLTYWGKGDYQLKLIGTDGWNVVEDIVDFTVKKGTPKPNLIYGSLSDMLYRFPLFMRFLQEFLLF